ncbi:MAG: alpha/beta fold hydrolase [Bacteriovoracaceae bacterium]
MLTEYPFQSHYFQLTDQLKLHYIDEGSGDVILMVHGNPTWSYYYRNLVSHFKKDHRCIAIDHIGCGFSSKPQDYDYCLENHIQNLTKLIDHLNLKNITLVVHDWGGAIGFGYATRFPSNVKKMVILNTAAFPDLYIPKRINILKLPVIGEWAVRTFNLFAWPATFMTTVKPLRKEIRDAYLSPYHNFETRIATSRFVQDIPMNKSHKTYGTLSTIESKLPSVTCPKLMLWGEQDFCFTSHFYRRFLSIFPETKSELYSDAGHYVLEDRKESVIQSMEKFL